MSKSILAGILGQIKHLVQSSLSGWVWDSRMAPKKPRGAHHGKPSILVSYDGMGLDRWKEAFFS